METGPATCEILYTIGHSNHELREFLALLHQHGVSVVADVRSSPYSAFNRQFNRETLQSQLSAAGIGYVFLGDELGARRREPECYDDQGRVCYDRVAQTPSFRAGLQRVTDVRRTQRVALMCAEKDPLTCHRAILICRALRELAPDIRHIHGDGSLEAHEAAESRLLALCNLPARDLFRSRDELIADAYARQAARIAYVSSERGRVHA